MAAVNTFSSAPERNGVAVTSTIDNSALIAKTGGDTYFDSANKIHRVNIVYQHVDGRQKKTISHFGGTGTVAWSSNAHAGVWQKMIVKLEDTDGALLEIDRGTIGTGEDLTLT